MKKNIDRQTVDLSAYPDLVVIYLGLRINRPGGLLKAIKLGPAIDKSVAAKPDGLLLHESITFSLFPPHMGMRQYWRDFESLERWSRSLPHQEWWKEYLRDPGGTGFWHEIYFRRGGMEAVYDDMKIRTGFAAFAPLEPARGPMFSARGRLNVEGEPTVPVPLTEEEVYGNYEL